MHDYPPVRPHNSPTAPPASANLGRHSPILDQRWPAFSQHGPSLVGICLVLTSLGRHRLAFGPDWAIVIGPQLNSPEHLFDNRRARRNNQTTKMRSQWWPTLPKFRRCGPTPLRPQRCVRAFAAEALDLRRRMPQRSPESRRSEKCPTSTEKALLWRAAGMASTPGVAKKRATNARRMTLGQTSRGKQAGEILGKCPNKSSRGISGAMSGRRWLKSNNPGHVGKVVTKFDPFWSNSDRCWAELAHTVLMWTNSGLKLAPTSRC